MKLIMRSRIQRTVFVCLVLAALRVTAQPPPPPVPSGRALLISDIHLDPLADPTIVKQLIAAPATQWTAIFQSSKRQSYSSYGADPNYPLVSSALKEAATQGRYDYVVFTGDALRHDFSKAFIAAGGTSQQFPAFATKAEVFVVRTLQQTFGAPVLAALGNNDTTCEDYQIPLNSPFLAATADELTVLAKSPEAKATFRLGGFFSVPHPAVANKDIVVLNSILWSASSTSCTPNSGDPGAAELDWLSWKLYAAKLQHHTVTLVMHIPPGIDPFQSSQSGNCQNAVPLWSSQYAAQFAALMQTYSDIVQLTFTGHTHMDDFRVAAGGTSSLPLRITPAVSPKFGNNPGFSILSYDLKTGAVSDITTFYLPLSSPSPQWSSEYQFSSTYGVTGFNAASLATVTAGIQSGGAAQQTFENNYAVSAPSPINSSNVAFFSCAQTNFNGTDYSNCVCGANSGRAK